MWCCSRWAPALSLTYITGKNLDWGYAQWAKPLVSLMLDGVGGIADYQCKQILGNQLPPPGAQVPARGFDPDG